MFWSILSFKIEKETFFSVFLVRGKSERIEIVHFTESSGLSCWDRKKVLLPITQLWERRHSYDKIEIDHVSQQPKETCQRTCRGPKLNWQCCLAGSSKTAPEILIFSMAMGADYSFELIFIETYTPQFNGQNKLFLVSVDGRISL